MKRSLLFVALACALLCSSLCSCSGGKNDGAATSATVASSPIVCTFGDYEYNLMADGTAKISKYKGTEEKLEISVPDYLDGVKVTVIGSASFADVAGISIINLPSTVTAVEDKAFAGCKATKIFLDKSGAVSIGKEAFLNCTELVQANLPRSLESLGDKAFAGCAKLYHVTFRGNTANIAENAFEGCEGLTVHSADSFNNIKTYCSDNSITFKASVAVAAPAATTAAQ